MSIPEDAKDGLQKAREISDYYAVLRKDMNVRSWMSDDLHNVVLYLLALIDTMEKSQ